MQISAGKPLRKAMPKRHTGYAFDHPGFEYFHADEEERRLALFTLTSNTD